MDSSQGGEVDASSVPAGRAETVETMDSSQGGAVDACSAPSGRVEAAQTHQQPPAPTKGTAKVPPQSCRVGKLPPTVMGRTRGQNQRLQGESAQRQRVIEDVMPAAVQKWTEFGSILENTSWTTEDAMAMMAGGRAAEENTGESNLFLPSDFPEDVEPPPQSVADEERSQYKAAWRKAMKTESDGHKTTGTYEAATPPRGRNPVGVKWVFPNKTDKDGIIAKTKARLVSKGFSQVQDVDYFQMFAPTPSSALIKILAAVANEEGLKIFRLDVAQAFVRAKLDAEIYMKLPDGCNDMSGKIVRLNRSL